MRPPWCDAVVHRVGEAGAHRPRRTVAQRITEEISRLGGARGSRLHLGAAVGSIERKKRAWHAAAGLTGPRGGL